MTRATCGPASRAVTSWAMGTSSPPAMPCRTRKPIRDRAEPAQPHSMEARVKAVKLARYNPLGADAVNQTAAQGQHERKGQKVPAGDPLDGGEGHPQVLAQAGQGNVHHRGVQGGHERSQQHHAGDAPHPGIQGGTAARDEECMEGAPRERTTHSSP